MPQRRIAKFFSALSVWVRPTATQEHYIRRIQPLQ